MIARICEQSVLIYIRARSIHECHTLSRNRVCTIAVDVPSIGTITPVEQLIVDSCGIWDLVTRKDRGSNAHHVLVLRRFGSFM